MDFVTELQSANLERETGDLKKAEDLYLKILEKQPEDTRVLVHAHLGLAKTYKLLYQQEQEGDYVQKMSQQLDLATGYYEIANKEEQILIVGDQGELAAIKGDWSEAYRCWNSLAEMENLDKDFLARIYEHRAQALFMLGNSEQAEFDARSAVDMLSVSSLKNHDDYIWKVWYSGALMTLWKIIYKKDRKESEQLKERIEQLITDQRLKHRQRQWQELSGGTVIF